MQILIFKAKTYQKKKCIIKYFVTDSVIRANQRYHRQTLLEECKNEAKKNKIENLINDDLDTGSSDESDNESDNGFDNETDNDTSND